LSSNREPHTSAVPHLQEEHALWRLGYRCIAGIDEAGRGAWAGPVVAAAVVLPPAWPGLSAALGPVRDSKLLSPRQRALCYDLVLQHALAWATGAVSAAEIDRVGIVPATRLAMRHALAALCIRPAHLLIDALTLEIGIPQRAIVKGDRICLSIAAASIIAKVTRDRMMRELDAAHPGYALARHKGYGTPQHRAALARLGSSPFHRHSYAPVALQDALECHD
jgi:ribonuclease HII